MRRIHWSLLLVVLALTPAHGFARCTTRGAANDCASSVCRWGDPQTWADCSGGVPDTPSEDWLIESGHTVSYDLDGLTTGTGNVQGTLLFDPTDTGRDANRFRSLSLTAAPAIDDLLCGSGGRIVLRADDRVRFDTTSGGATISLLNGCVWDVQGSVEQTTIAEILAEDGDEATCGTSGLAGRKYSIVPASGFDPASGVLRGRRLIIQSGALVNRHYEIVETGAGALTVCTDLADDRSLGQRLTLHAAVGRFPEGGRHSIPRPAAGVDRFDPRPGDAIAIVRDVWIDQSAGTAGYNFIMSNTGTDPFPINRAVHFNGLGIQGTHAMSFTVRTADQFVPPLDYINWHDWTSSFGMVFRGVKNIDVRWNAVHDSAPPAGNNYCALCFHQAKISEGSLLDTPVSNLLIEHNVAYGFKLSAININDADSGTESPLHVASGIRIRANLIHDGCTTASTTVCRGIEVDACRGCDISGNVIFDICRPDGRSGSGIVVGGEAQNRGTSVHDNWMVNLCGSGIIAAEGPAMDSSTNRSLGITHNYVSNVRDAGGLGGNWYSNVIKNFGMDAHNASDGWGIRNPIGAFGNYIMGLDPSLDALPPCAANGGCARFGLDYGRGGGDTIRIPVVASDNIIVRLRNRYQRAAIHLGSPNFPPDFDGTFRHLTFDNRSGGPGVGGIGVQFDFPANPAVPVLYVLQDMLTTHAGDIGHVVCTLQPGVAEVLGEGYSTRTQISFDGGGAVSSDCVSGHLVRLASPGYVNRLAGNYNFQAGAVGLTAGAIPPGSPIGARAFRFDRSKLSAPWAFSLSFDGEFPADVANVDNADSDGDGVLDLHDNCDTLANPDQTDEDRDGAGAACDCNDARPSALPGAPEICDGIDDDCDGAIDEDLGALSCGAGACARTVSACLDGVPQACVPGEPGPEMCNGIDDDCDGLVDIGKQRVDLDGDAVDDLCDNCRGVSNPLQEDVDGDMRGDVCDNCVSVANASQTDRDNDLEGDHCDLNDDLILVSLPDRTRVTWQHETGFDTFNEYRGDLAVLRATGVYIQDPLTTPLAGRTCDISAMHALEEIDPGPGGVIFYLVTGIAGGIEGSLGRDSAGVERVNSNPCPPP